MSVQGNASRRGNGSSDLELVERRFHELIVRRAKEFGCEWADSPRDLPHLDSSLIDKEYGEEDKEWFPVPGMYGGFAYFLHHVDGVLTLDAEHWSRVCGDWGQRHAITPTETILLEDHII